MLSFSEIKEKYSDFIILLSFASSLDNMLDRFYELDEKYEMYAPDVPVTGEGTFDLDFYEANKDKLEYVYSLLADDLSKKVYENTVKYKLTGKISYLKEIETLPDEVWDNILTPTKYRVCVDAGAYNGDTAREMIAKCPNVEKIYALEPDSRNFKKLSAYAEEEKRIVPINAAVWNRDDKLLFDAGGNRNSNFFTINSKKTTEIEAKTIDGICQNAAVDYIKYDVEGAEHNALIGSKETIKRCSPDLLVSVYHRNEDLFDLPLFIKEISPDYKLYLRKYKYVPAWDLNLLSFQRK